MSTATELKNEFARAAADRPLDLQEAKNDGAKVIEFIGNFAPEEMIHASGAKPYLICRGGEPEPPEAVLGDILRFINPLARSIPGFYKLGLDPVMPIADLVVASQHECHIQRVAEYLEFQDIPVHKIGVASDWTREFAANLYYDELMETKQKIEEVTGNEISDEKLARSISIYNEINAELRKIGELRKKDNPPLGGADFIRLNHYSFATDPEYALEKLKQLYDELKDAPGIFPENAPRILLVGHAVAVGDYVVIDKLEESGLIIANEFMDEGIRWYQWDTDTEGDLVRNIWKQRYMDKVPVNILQPGWHERFDFISQIIEDYRIDGVIWYQLLYDEIYDMEYTCVSNWLSEKKVPLMKIETSYEYTREAMLPLTTRIESFVEVLKTRKGGQ